LSQNVLINRKKPLISGRNKPARANIIARALPLVAIRFDATRVLNK
jgi:hypothetical protein